MAALTVPRRCRASNAVRPADAGLAVQGERAGAQLHGGDGYRRIARCRGDVPVGVRRPSDPLGAGGTTAAERHVDHELLRGREVRADLGQPQELPRDLAAGELHAH
jgi:hypothetical protein